MSRTRLLLMGIGIRIWFILTQFLSSFRCPELANIPTIAAIALTVARGSLYRPDRRAGALMHPCRVQKRAYAKRRLGDCEDHAAYWIARLLHGKLVARAWLGCVYFTMPDGAKTGHAVCVFTDFDGKTYWADYTNPTPAGDHSSFQPGWDWALGVASSFGSTFTGAIMFEIPCLTGRQGLSFGKMRVMSPKS